MGVPAFFRWLSRKYASIIVQCVEEKKREVAGHETPVDATKPNPNDIEFDNLYLDMNGIIHPCCHPEDKPAPKDEDEMMAAIFEYIDRIFNIVRPRRLLYMAIDGVAPRAKMNQQRSRRFRAAKESHEKQSEIARIRGELELKGHKLPPPKPKGSHFDSNCITPGTEFMANLAVCLQYYIHDRMNNNPAWRNIKVILSDANVPGEGEHKIMDYIRRQRGQADHDPNTHHCLYGADADLIMLGLATHEPHFTILREEFQPNQQQNKACEICGQVGHAMSECTGEAREKEGEFDELAVATAPEKQFIFIRLCVLREYLEIELMISGLPFPFELERAIDDWVFLCFFVGNDFLPHLPSLEIREGAIDRLIRLYKEVVPRTHGYLTCNGRVNLSRVQMILTELGKVEGDIFKNRRRKDEELRRRHREKRRRNSMYAGPPIEGGQFSPPIGFSPQPVQDIRQEAYRMRSAPTTPTSNREAAASLKANLKRSQTESGSLALVGRKRKREEDSDSEPEDAVRLWEDGWKERYYQDKFGVPSDDHEFRGHLTEQYTRGLCWVLGYYYQGCPSWKWFYPYHYAPFASDFRDIKGVRSDFNRGTKPFCPLEQLMGVFPSTSGKFLPPTWRTLMSADTSAIVDLYPTDFQVDLNGKKYTWQGVALLPFINEDRLHKALAEVYPDLTVDEATRNSLGADQLFVCDTNSVFPSLHTLYEDVPDGGTPAQGVDLNPKLTLGVRGSVGISTKMAEIVQSGGTVPSPLADFPTIKNTRALCVTFKDPQYPVTHVFEAKLLPGATIPDKVLRPASHRGPWTPRTGFKTPTPRTYSTPHPARRMILPQRDSHGFR